MVTYFFPNLIRFSNPCRAFFEISESTDQTGSFSFSDWSSCATAFGNECREPILLLWFAQSMSGHNSHFLRSFTKYHQTGGNQYDCKWKTGRWEGHSFFALQSKIYWLQHVSLNVISHWTKQNLVVLYCHVEWGQEQQHMLSPNPLLEPPLTSWVHAD